LNGGLGPKQGVEFDSPGAWLVAIASVLESRGVPLCIEFAEMVRTDMSAEPLSVCGARAATELLLEPMTTAEATASQMLLAAVTHARETQLDDDALPRLMALLAVYVARFESYLAERSVRDAY